MNLTISLVCYTDEQPGTTLAIIQKAWYVTEGMGDPAQEYRDGESMTGVWQHSAPVLPSIATIAAYLAEYAAPIAARAVTIGLRVKINVSYQDEQGKTTSLLLLPAPL